MNKIANENSSDKLYREYKKDRAKESLRKSRGNVGKVGLGAGGLAGMTRGGLRGGLAGAAGGAALGAAAGHFGNIKSRNTIRNMNDMEKQSNEEEYENMGKVSMYKEEIYKEASNKHLSKKHQKKQSKMKYSPVNIIDDKDAGYELEQINHLRKTTGEEPYSRDEWEPVAKTDWGDYIAVNKNDGRVYGLDLEDHLNPTGKSWDSPKEYEKNTMRELRENEKKYKNQGKKSIMQRFPSRQDIANSAKEMTKDVGVGITMTGDPILTLDATDEVKEMKNNISRFIDRAANKKQEGPKSMDKVAMNKEEIYKSASENKKPGMIERHIAKSKLIDDEMKRLEDTPEGRSANRSDWATAAPAIALGTANIGRDIKSVIKKQPRGIDPLFVASAAGVTAAAGRKLYRDKKGTSLYGMANKNLTEEDINNEIERRRELKKEAIYKAANERQLTQEDYQRYFKDNPEKEEEVRNAAGRIGAGVSGLTSGLTASGLGGAWAAASKGAPKPVRAAQGAVIGGGLAASALGARGLRRGLNEGNKIKEHQKEYFNR